MGDPCSSIRLHCRPINFRFISLIWIMVWIEPFICGRYPLILFSLITWSDRKTWLASINSPEKDNKNMASLAFYCFQAIHENKNEYWSWKILYIHSVDKIESPKYKILVIFAVFWLFESRSKLQGIFYSKIEHIYHKQKHFLITLYFFAWSQIGDWNSRQNWLLWQPTWLLLPIE